MNLRLCGLKLLIVLLGIGCAPGANNSDRPNHHIDGTSDSGGGNGVENKVYEAYIVQPDQLQAYKALIEPRVSALLTQTPDKGRALAIIRRWLFYKTWYVAPVSLGTISKDVIGVSFSSDNTEQLALQTKRSVWIDSRRFAQMNIQDQAFLIAHEMLMSLYYLRFKSWSQICNEKIYFKEQCSPQDIDALDEMFPGTEATPFDSQDYENIRAVTARLLGREGLGSLKQIDDVLISNGFDRRFTFGLGLSGESGGSQRFVIGFSNELRTKEIEMAIRSAPVLNQSPDTCLGLRTKTKSACHFLAEEGSFRNRQGQQIPTIRLSIQARAPERQFSAAGFVIKMDKITGSSVEWVEQKRRLHYFVFYPEPFPTSTVEGTAFRTLIVVLSEDLAQPSAPKVLLGLQLIPGVVTGANPDVPGECSFARPSTSSQQSDVVLAHSKNLSTFDLGLLRFRASTMPPATSCRAF